jgi:hypothetical protein
MEFKPSLVVLEFPVLSSESAASACLLILGMVLLSSSDPHESPVEEKQRRVHYCYFSSEEVENQNT